MAIRLYTVSGSPFCWRVHLALEHKGADYELKWISESKGENRADAYLAINPRGKVPAITDDDFALYESGAILEYLEDRFPDGPALFPGDVQARALIRRLAREFDHYCWEHHWKLTRNLFFKRANEWDLDEVESGRQGWMEELATLEANLQRDYLAGDAISAADFSLYPLIATFPRFELRKPELQMTASLGPKLQAWKSRIEALPYFDKTFPPHWRERP